MSALGTIAYHGFFRPFGFFRTFFSHQGFVQERLNRWHGARMREAARLLHPLPVPAESLGTAHYLTGSSFWHLSAFAAYSLQLHTDGMVRPIFHCDGRLDESTKAELGRLFPRAEFVTSQRQEVLLACFLPEKRFPVLRKLWREFVLIRKLLSVHLGQDGWSLFLDSDTMFWHRPDFLIGWYERRERPICMQDLSDQYGYERSSIERIISKPLPCKVNTGLIALHASMINLDRLEHLARELLSVGGRSHFLEQTITAMLLADQHFDYAPPHEYLIPERKEQCFGRRAVFLHYAGPARKWYYSLAWRQMEVARSGCWSPYRLEP